MRTFGQHGLIGQDQLCNSLLHNWNSADREAGWLMWRGGRRPMLLDEEVAGAVWVSAAVTSVLPTNHQECHKTPFFSMSDSPC